MAPCGLSHWVAPTAYRHGWGFADEPPTPPPEAVRRPARVAQMLAQARRLQAAIDRGDYRDRAELARQIGSRGHA